MNKETFISYIDNESLLGKTSINELNELIDEFPFCSTAHILLSLNLRKEDHFKYDTVLKRTAIYAPDRSLLRKHLEKISAPEQTATLPDEDVEVEEVSEELIVEPNFQETMVIQKEEPEKDDIEDLKPEVTETEILPEPAKKDLEPEQLHSKAENDQERMKKVKIEDQEEKKPEVKAVEKDTLSELRKIVHNRLKQIELEKQQKEESFKVKKEEPKPVKKKKESKSESELIDKFIKTEPSITRRQSTFFDPIDAAKDSVTDEENIVSETLAEIYFGQRKFEKAISVYKKLSLKFPEKSSYFAARIEKAVEELKK